MRHLAKVKTPTQNFDMRSPNAIRKLALLLAGSYQYQVTGLRFKAGKDAHHQKERERERGGGFRLGASKKCPFSKGDMSFLVENAFLG